MQKYFFDTEFMEGTRRPIWWLPTIFGFNKKVWFIELISIGIVCEDGRKYYAISDEFHREYANKWVRENVITKLPKKYIYDADVNAEPIYRDGETYVVYTSVRNPLYKSIYHIATDIVEFINPHLDDGELEKKQEYWDAHSTKVYSPAESGGHVFIVRNRPAFYAYFADYDWVMLCTLFGSMMKLPTGFPMYCNDLKQMLDETVWEITEEEKVANLGKGDLEHFNANLKMVKAMPEYPAQGEDEHRADDDADFNFRLYNFIGLLRKARKNI